MNKMMMNISIYQTCAIILSLASAIDSIYHMVIVTGRNGDNLLHGGGDPPTSGSGPTPLAHLYALMALRLLFSLHHSATTTAVPARFRHHQTFISVFHCCQSFVVLVLGCRLIRFDRYVLSLIVHLLTVFVSGTALLDHLFAVYLLPVGENGSVRAKDEHNRWRRILLFVKQNLMPLGTVAAVVLAIIVGGIIRSNGLPWSSRNIMYLNIGGELFLRVLKCLVLPLIFSSLVFAIGNMDTQLSNRVAIRALLFYLSTTLVAIITGIILVVLIKPGAKHKVDHDHENGIHVRHLTTMDTILDLFRNVCPDNIIQACFQYYTTVLIPPANGTENVPLDQWKVDATMESGTNILGVVSFAVIFGATIGRVEERDIIVRFFKGFNEIIMEMTAMVIRLTPLAVMFLILPQIIQVKDLDVLIGAVGFYSITILVGLAFHATLTLPFIYWTVTRQNPYRLLSGISAALVTAFGTSSSSATMPVTFRCLEEQCRLDSRVVRFCIPVGATMNMDGTALYEAVAAIFIAQYRDVQLDFIQLVIVSITATAASIGAAGIPQAGLITMVIVLNSVGLDAADAVLIIVVDWFLDRFRTVTNVIGDSLGCGLVNHLSRADMDQLSSPLEGEITVIN